MRMAAALLLFALCAPALAQTSAGRADDASDEPRPYVIERIALLGLQRTQPDEIRDHLIVKEGDVLDNQRVLLSRLRLLQLGYFSQVEARVQRGSTRGKVVLVFVVKERNTLLVSDLVLGSTPTQPVYGGLGLNQLNFLGRGLALSGAFVYGGVPLDLGSRQLEALNPSGAPRFSARAGFFDPDVHVGGLPHFVFGVSGLWLRGQEFECFRPDCSDHGGASTAPRLVYTRAGGEGDFGVRFGPYERLMAGFRFERIAASSGCDATAGGCAFAHGLGVLGVTHLAALHGTYERDSRNDTFFPTEGTRIVGDITFGSQLLGGDFEYSRYLVTYEHDFGLWKGHALKLLGEAGAVQGGAPFFERFYPADYAYFSVGPALGRALDLNFSTDSRYDSVLALLGAEYGVPLWSGDRFFQRGYLALGARWLYTSVGPGSPRTDASTIPFSFDIALRLDTPVGIFNASIGYALDNVL